jgi:hypothetical protein
MLDQPFLISLMLLWCLVRKFLRIRLGSRRFLCFRLALDVAGGVPFGHLGGVGFAMALAFAISRLAQVLVTCHWSSHYFEFGVLTTGERGDSRGNLRSGRGEFS